MTEQEILDILNSDMKLWERAKTEHVTHEDIEDVPPGVVAISKTLDLPFGLGTRTFVFVEDNIASVETLGSMVRGLVDDYRSEERFEALRAESAAKKKQAEATSEVAGGDAESDTRSVDWEHGPSSGDTLEVASQASISTSIEAIPTGSGLADRADGLRRAIGEAERNTRRWRKELRALEAALEILNAPEDDGEE